MAISLLLLRVIHNGAHFAHWHWHLRIELVPISNGTTEISGIDYRSFRKTGLFHRIRPDAMHFGDVWQGAAWALVDILLQFFLMNFLTFAIFPQLAKSSFSYYLIFRSLWWGKWILALSIEQRAIQSDWTCAYYATFITVSRYYFYKIKIQYLSKFFRNFLVISSTYVLK